MKVGFDVRVSALCLLLAPTVSSTGAAETVADTKFSVNRGFYVIPFRVKISSVTPDAEIRYTTDGSEPALNHGSGGPSPQLVEVTTTTVLRAKAFREGLEPTNVDTQTYLFTNHVLEQPDEIPGYPSLVMRTSGSTSVTLDYGMDPEIARDPAYRERLLDGLESIPSISLVLPKEQGTGEVHVESPLGRVRVAHQQVDVAVEKCLHVLGPGKVHELRPDTELPGHDPAQLAYDAARLPRLRMQVELRVRTLFGGRCVGHRYAQDTSVEYEVEGRHTGLILPARHVILFAAKGAHMMRHDLVGSLDERCRVLGNVSCQTLFDFRVVWIVGEVGPLFRIVSVVVELLAVVDIPDIAPVLGADRELEDVIGSDRRMIPRGRRVREKRRQAVAIQSVFFGQAGKRDEGGEEVHQGRHALDTAPRRRALGQAGRAARNFHHQHRSSDVVPERKLRCLRCLLLVMCTHPFAKEALTLHLARSEGHERYFGYNLVHRKVLASFHQHLMAEAPCGFFDYYNFHHRHSGIGLMTPADVHYGRAEQLTTARRQILLEAQQAHPERFVRGTPQPPVLPPQA